MLKSVFAKTVINTRFWSVFIASTFSMVSTYLLMLTDNVVAGQMVGENAVMGMTLIFPIVTGIIFVSYLIADGLVMLYSYAKGRGDRDEETRLFSLGVILSVITGILFTAVFIGFREQILSFWDISDHLRGYADDYYSGLLLFAPASFIDTFLYTVFIAEGNERVCVIASIVAFAVNVVLDFFLCMHIGITGIGIASTAGLIVSTLVQIRYLTGGQSQLRLIWYFDIRKTMKGVWYSFYHAIDTLLLAILPVILSAFVLSRFGEASIIIVTVGMNLLELVIAVYTGMVDCLQPMVCQYHAEKNLHSVKKTMNVGMFATVAVSLAMTVLGIVFENFLPGLFGVKETSMTREIAEAMRCFLPFMVFLGSTLMYSNYYIYIEERNYGALLKTLLMLVFPLIGMYCGAAFSMNGLWLGMGISFAAAFLLNWLLTKKWSRNRKGLLLMNETELDRQLSYDINSAPEEVTALAQKAASVLQASGENAKRCSLLAALIEQLGLHAAERSGDTPFQLEYSILPGETASEPLRMILRDNAEPCDIIERIKQGSCSQREALIDSLTAGLKSRQYSASGDENRMMLQI